MKETLIDYLGSLKGYQFEMKNPALIELDKVFGYKFDDNSKLIRPDNSIAAKFEDDIKWVTSPTQQEMIDYGMYGDGRRGLPSMLCYKGDPTNPGAQ